MSKKKLTIGIPMYNAEKYIDELIKCFEFDSDLSFELIVVNDGSTDSSLGICKKYSHLIKIVDKKNGGVSSARNRIIEEAEGEWITFIDADDLISFEEYKNEFNKIVKTNVEFSINVLNFKKYKRVKRSSNPLSYMIESEIINFPCARFYKTDIIKKKNIRFDSMFSIGEDLIFNLEYYVCCKNVNYFCNKKMYLYRTINNNSLSRKYRKNKYSELMRVNDRCFKICEGKGKKIEKSLEYRRIRACLSCVKDMATFSKYFENPVLEIRKMKSDNPKKYLVLNNIKDSIIYNLWYWLPDSIIYSLVKLIKSSKK